MMFSWIVIPVSSLAVYFAAQVRKWHFSGMIRYLSSLSYCFYLAQLYSNTLSKYFIGRYEISSNSLRILIAWMMCISISVILHHVVELPLVSYLRNKILKTPA